MCSDAIQLEATSRNRVKLPGRGVSNAVVVSEAQAHVLAELIPDASVALITEHPRIALLVQRRRADGDILGIKDSPLCAGTRADEWDEATATD